MTPRSIITLARSIVNDADSVYYRTSDDDLVLYVNDGLKEMVAHAPQYFMQTGDLTCAVGETEQSITFADAKELLDITRIKGGKSITPMDMMAMSRFNPDWPADAAAAAENWCRFPGDPLRFYLYPKAPEMQVLEVLYIRNPATYTIDQDIAEVPENTAPALADYVIYRAESKDDEHVLSARAVSHYQAFVQKLGGGTQEGVA